MGERQLALASLSTGGAGPLDLVRLAAQAGFDQVGALRIVPTLAGAGASLVADRRLLAATRRTLAECGLRVLDVEVFRLGPGGAAEAEPLLEVGAELGAQHLLTMVVDEEPGRRRETVHELAALAAGYGVVPVVEFMVFSAVRTLADALALVDGLPVDRVGVLVDALHLSRSGGHPRDLDGVPVGRLPYVQLNDSLDAGPADSPDDALVEAVSNRLAPGEGVLPLGDLLGRLAPEAPVSVEAPLPAGWAVEEWAAHLARCTRDLVANV